MASHRVQDCFIHPFVFPGFSDSDAAAMNVDVADLVDKLDLSMSSIDMTNTALAMHEEKDGEISGVGKLGPQNFIPVSWSFGQKEYRLCLYFPLYRGAGGQCAAFIISRKPD